MRLPRAGDHIRILNNDNGPYKGATGRIIEILPVSFTAVIRVDDQYRKKIRDLDYAVDRARISYHNYRILHEYIDVE